jgi:hypothetical protein
MQVSRLFCPEWGAHPTVDLPGCRQFT